MVLVQKGLKAAYIGGSIQWEVNNYIPTLTSTSSDWFVCSSSSLLTSNFHAWDCFDNNTGTELHSSNIGNWNWGYSQIEMPEWIIVTKLWVQSKTSSSSNIQLPKAFYLQWSNDWSNWTNIGSQVNNPFTAYYQTYELTITWETTAYKYLKLNLQAWGTWYFAISAWNVDWITETKQSVKTIYVGSTQVRPTWLPSAYQEVEYISSSSAWPRIDLWFTPTINTVSHIKFINLWVTWGVIYWFSNGYYDAYRVFNYQSKIYYYVGPNWPVGSTLTANTLYEFEVWNFYVKNVWASTNLVSTTALSSMSVTWTITLNRDAAGNASSRNTWYYVKIWDNGTLVRDMIPCYRKLDNVIWMYDAVNGVFYTNSGSWTFTKWPNV